MKIFKSLVLAIILGFGLFSFKQDTDPIKSIEKAHQKNAFLKNDIIQFDLFLKFGNKEMVNATFTFNTNSSKGIIENKDGSKIYIHNNKVFYSPNYKNIKSIRFDAYTWSYFFLFPYKLSDAGTKWSEFGEGNSNNKTFNTQKLSFTPDTGDAPDDWYCVYSDKESNLINTAAYIVTYKKSIEKAESNPHAIKYDGYANINGIPIATKWSFWNWNKANGISSQIGEATISNIQFLSRKDVSFDIPENFIEIK